ncbi:AAA family ATPase [Candidatus Sumerlaeota bacterium]
MLKKVHFTPSDFCRLRTPVSTNWIVITGAPSSGKTTLVRELSLRGYSVLGDPARELILETKQASKVMDARERQRRITAKMLQMYSSTPTNRLTFLDYGMPDNLLYQVREDCVEEITERISKLIRYRAVFLLTPLPVEHDGVRVLNAKEQHDIHGDIEAMYRSLGYEPIGLQASSLDFRLGVVLKYIEEIAVETSG